MLGVRSLRSEGVLRSVTDGAPARGCCCCCSCCSQHSQVCHPSRCRMRCTWCSTSGEGLWPAFRPATAAGCAASPAINACSRLRGAAQCISGPAAAPPWHAGTSASSQMAHLATAPRPSRCPRCTAGGCCIPHALPSGMHARGCAQGKCTACRCCIAARTGMHAAGVRPGEVHRRWVLHSVVPSGLAACTRASTLLRG